MIQLEPIIINGHMFKGVSVKLPKTNLLTISNENGYIMCGALDVDLLNEKLLDRKIVGARAIGVRSLEDLLEAPLNKVTVEAKRKYGWEPGMIGREALLRLVDESN
ncbi:DUF1805 domain-containing protein [Bacillaceae bacterium S4-13-58]